MFQALRSPSLPVRQVSLRVILKGTPSRWQLRDALMSLVNTHVLQEEPCPESAIQLVGLLSHLVSEDQPWRDPVLHETDMELTSFVAAGGLRWVTHSILKLVQSLLPLLENSKKGHLQSNTLIQKSDMTLEALQLKLCLMIHFCYRLVLYSAVPSPPKISNKEKSPCAASEAGVESSAKKRRRAFSETSEKSASPLDEKKFKDLATDRLATLQQLHQHFWSTTLPASNSTLSPLACLLCAYEMLRDRDNLPAKTKRTSQCLSILARLVNPNATATVVSYEEASGKNKKTSQKAETARAVPLEGAISSMVQAVSAVDVMEEDDEDVVMEELEEEEDDDDDDDDDEIMEEQEDSDVEQNAQHEEGLHPVLHDEEFADEGDSDDIIAEEDEIDSEEEDEEGGDEEGEEVEEEQLVVGDHDDIVNVVRQFEMDLGNNELLQQPDGEEGLALDRGRSQTASSIPPATEKDRSNTLIKACMQILAVQHPPAAAGMLHGSTAKSGQPKRRNQSASQRPLLSPSAEQALIKRVCNIVKPPRKPLNLRLFMRRAPTQEEFFRGSLTRNPIRLASLSQPGASSTEPTVRDLRQHIADDLQMSDSAELIELLVANQILDLSLKLRVVQQVLWKNYLADNSSAAARQPASSFFGSGLAVIFGSSSGETIGGHNITADTPVSDLPPMVVTYRLAGVDGEATEEIVSSLEDPEAPSSSTSAEEQERLMENEYGMTRLVTDGRGISILLRSIESDIFDALRRIRRDDVARLSGVSEGSGSNPSRAKFQQSPPCSGLTLLRHCTKLASNRKKLLEAQAPTFLLRLLLDVLNALDEASSRAAAGLSQAGSSDESSPDETHAVTNPTADLLQELIEILASDLSPELETALASSADKLNEAAPGDTEEDAEEAASTLPLLLSSLRTIYLGPPMRKVIAKLLPFLTYGQASLSRELAANFVTYVNIDALGDMKSGDKPVSRASVLMDTFVQAAISIPPSGVCNSLRAELGDFVEQLVAFILKDIPQNPPPWSPALWSKGDEFGGMKRDAIEKMWRSYFLRSGLQTAFKMLAGLCNGHEPTQSLIANVGARKSAKGDASFLTACHWLESTSNNSSLAIETKDLGLLAETLLDELSSGNERVSKKVKALRKETRNRKKEIAQETRSKTLVSMSSFGPMAGDTNSDQNQASAAAAAAAADGRGQSAVGIVGSVARRAASLLSGGPATRSAKIPPKKSDKSKPSWLEEMEAMEDETGLTCAICQEGRTLQPSELLGLYTFVKKVTIPFMKGGGRTHIDGSVLLVSLPRSLPPSIVNTNADHEWFRPARIAADSIKESTDIEAVMASGATANRRSTNLITPVAAGNAIHCSCHSKARSADRNHPRAPKSKSRLVYCFAVGPCCTGLTRAFLSGEWEGASLRNSRVQCNAILPLVSSKSSKVSLMAVDMALTEQQSIISNVLGQKPRSNLWLVLHDVRLLLLRMAYGEALNADCGGGSLTSNAALLFYQLFMADMFANDAEHDAPYTAQHARFLSAGFLAATNLLRANDFDASGSTGAALTRGIADAAPMASLCCILFYNNSDEDTVEPQKGVAPHPRRRWALQKEEFLRGLIACAGRRHALSIEDSGCFTASRGSRASRVRSRSFTEWDLAEEGASSRRKPTSILGKRGLPQIDDFAKALRPMLTLYAIFDQLSSDFVVGMDDQAVEASASRLAEAAETCQKSKDIHELLQRAKVTLDHEEIIEYLQKGMVSA